LLPPPTQHHSFFRNFHPLLFLCTKFSELFALSLIFLWKTPKLQAISEEKNTFKPLCWNVNENCEVDVAIDRAGYHSKKLPENNYSSGFFRSFYLASLTFGYLRMSSSTAYAAKC